MSNALAIKHTGTLDYSNPEVVQTLKTTVAVDATPEEFAMFLAFCQSTGLNPYKKEIWFIKTKGYTTRDGRTFPGRVQMMTGINGFFQIANKHAQYDGMEEPAWEEGPDGLPVKCTVRVWRKDRRFPSVGIARWKEYFPGVTEKRNSIWETKPYVMLAKVAKSIALREAFPQELNGLLAEEEYHDEGEQETPKPKGFKGIDHVPLDKDELPGEPKSDPALEIQNAIDGEDWVRVGDHIILTKCSLQGMTVRTAITRFRPTVVANVKKLKKKADRLAIEAYLATFPLGTSETPPGDDIDVAIDEEAPNV